MHIRHAWFVVLVLAFALRLVGANSLESHCGATMAEEFTQSVETELKYEVRKEGFERLVAHLEAEKDPKSRVEMVNFYFDTPDFDLYDNGFRLRIRVLESSETVISLKEVVKATLGKKGDRPKIRIEREKEITEKEAQQIVSGKKKLLKKGEFPWSVLEDSFPKKTKSQVVFLGSIPVVRTSFQWKGLVLEVDEGQVSGESFYELEVEIADESEKEATDEKVRSLLEGQKIPFKFKPMSKTRRIMEAYSEAN